jgi:hypothetical protein
VLGERIHVLLGRVVVLPKEGKKPVLDEGVDRRWDVAVVVSS